MDHIKPSQSGFSALLIFLLITVTGIIGLGAWRFIDSDANKTVNHQTDSTTTSQLSPLDAATLAQAQKLKKVDFDLDGVVNSKDSDDDNDGIDDNVDSDDDNDGIDDNVDNDDDNDGIDDDVDNDDDNDGIDDDKDDEADQEAELQEADHGSSESNQ